MSNLQTDSTVQIYSNQGISANFESFIIDIQQLEGFGFHILWSGLPSIVGRVELLASLDRQNWVKVDGSGQRITGASGQHMYNVTDFNYRYIKLKIEVTTNSSIFNIWFNSRSRRV